MTSALDTFGCCACTGTTAQARSFGARWRRSVIIYDDGAPRTRNVTTNVVIEADDEAGTALARAYFTVLQALPGFPLQPVVSGRYLDRFERRNGQWVFTQRRVLVDLVGDVSRHLRRQR